MSKKKAEEEKGISEVEAMENALSTWLHVEQDDVWAEIADCASDDKSEARLAEAYGRLKVLSRLQSHFLL